jgi:hypothetical protein
VFKVDRNYGNFRLGKRMRGVIDIACLIPFFCEKTPFREKYGLWICLNQVTGMSKFINLAGIGYSSFPHS